MATTSATSTALDSDALYEVVDGEIVETPPMGIYEAWLASFLYGELHSYLKVHGCGRAVVEPLIDFTEAVGRKRRPDLAYVSYDRWPREKQMPRTEAWKVAPDLVVEVVSPSNQVDEVIDKVAEYYRAGVQRVWVIYPTQRQIYVYSTPTDVRIVAENEELSDEKLLPGFRLALNTLFDDTASGK
jgi:Uma2 family endonuclease